MTTSAATPWALLGNIEFQLSEAPRAFSSTKRVRFVEIPRIEQKPATQWTGDELRDLRLSFRFGAAWCDPDQQLRRLQQAQSDHTPMGLTLGGGTLRGYYLIEQVGVKLIQSDAEGNALVIEVDVALNETTDKPAPATPRKSPFAKRAA
ncbi:MAG: phage tail protein [Cyanobacteria bacterium J06635_1]